MYLYVGQPLGILEDSMAPESFLSQVLDLLRSSLVDILKLRPGSTRWTQHQQLRLLVLNNELGAVEACSRAEVEVVVFDSMGVQSTSEESFTQNPGWPYWDLLRTGMY